MITTVRDTNTTMDDVKKKLLTYLKGQQGGIDRGLAFPASTAKLIKLLGLPPRVARQALAELRKDGKAVYHNDEHGWTL
jgi:hypothetical protein